MSEETKSTLLIWCQIHEDTTLYFIPDAPEWLSKVHGYYWDSVDTPQEIGELLERVFDARCEDPASCSDKNKDIATTWAKYKIPIEHGNPPVLLDTRGLRVVHTGQYL